MAQVYIPSLENDEDIKLVHPHQASLANPRAGSSTKNTVFIKLSPRATAALPIPMSTPVSAPTHWLGSPSVFPREIFPNGIDCPNQRR